MRFRNTLIALIVLLIVGGYAFVNYFYSRPIPARTVLAIKPADIEKIDLKYPDREIMLARKPGKDWMIVKPRELRADQVSATNLARAIAEAQVTETVEDKPESLVPFGLEPPRVTVTVTTNQGKTLAGIEVGKVTPVGYSVYLKLTDRPAVMLTAAAFQGGTDKTLDNLRDRSVMSFKIDEVKKFAIDRQNRPRIEIDREGDKWEIVKPALYSADPDVVHLILSSLANAKISDFVANAPSNPAVYGLQNPLSTITVYTNNGAEQSLLLGNKRTDPGKEGTYSERAGQSDVFTIGTWDAKSIDKSMLDLRDKTVLSFDPANIGTLKIESANREFSLTRAPGSGWNVIENGKTASADVAKVESLLDRIRSLKGDSIIMDPMKNPEMFGMNHPAEVISLVDKKGTRIGTVNLSTINVKEAPGQGLGPTETSRTDYYVTSSATTALFTTNDYSFKQLDQSANAFRQSPTPAPSGWPTPSSKK